MKNNEAYDAMNKEGHVCVRRRVGEPAVSESLHVCGRAVSRERPVSEKARRSHFTRPAPSGSVPRERRCGPFSAPS